MSTTEQTKPPVQVSGEAARILGENIRTWSGWPNASLTLGAPPPEAGSPWAATNMGTRQVWVNVDELSLNPNRVLNSVTPFRLKQEAVLTGAMLHEAAHARYTTWKPRNEEEAKGFTHPDGSDITEAQMSLAMLLEEPRIERRMAADSAINGSQGLEWTMIAMALHLFPIDLPAASASQHLMNLLGSWILRAGRRNAMALSGKSAAFMPGWVGEYGMFLSKAIRQYRETQGDTGPQALIAADTVFNNLTAALKWDEPGVLDPTLLGYSRDILDALFPEMGEQPKAEAAACGASGEEGTESDEGEDSEGEGPEGGGPEGEGSGQQSEDQKKIAEMMSGAGAEVANEVKKPPSAKKIIPAEGGVGQGISVEGTSITQWRDPSPEQRETSRQAARFLRDLVDPTETSATTVTDAPSALVDATALSRWKAGGREQSPRFFAQTRRDVQPAPPVKIAVLVDVSASMEVLAQPSAVLSWALSSAAVDLQNFAGRGTQVESTLIHWGDHAVVVQENGAQLPGIASHICPYGTKAMVEAFDLVEGQIPGFFSAKESGREENRLLIQFTDWGLSNWGGEKDRTREAVTQAMDNGVKMLTIAPPRVSGFVRNIEDEIIIPRLRPKHARVTFDPHNPTGVWDAAAEALKVSGN